MAPMTMKTTSVTPWSSASEPPPDCRQCARLVRFRQRNAGLHPDYHNAPVAPFGRRDAALLVVGLAPGLHGANRTGRPFTGDAAGALLYPTLQRFGFAAGHYGACAGDDFRLIDCRITNAVRCVPPQNRPNAAEARACGAFLAAEIAAMARLRALLALGRLAHDSVLAARRIARSRHPFGHGAAHAIGEGLILFDSYHCSRYNLNTRRLTPAMFDSVFESLRQRLDAGI